MAALSVDYIWFGKGELYILQMDLVAKDHMTLHKRVKTERPPTNGA